MKIFGGGKLDRWSVNVCGTSGPARRTEALQLRPRKARSALDEFRAKSSLQDMKMQKILGSNIDGVYALSSTRSRLIHYFLISAISPSLVIVDLNHAAVQ